MNREKHTGGNLSVWGGGTIKPKKRKEGLTKKERRPLNPKKKGEKTDCSSRCSGGTLSDHLCISSMTFQNQRKKRLGGKGRGGEEKNTSLGTDLPKTLQFGRRKRQKRKKGVPAKRDGGPLCGGLRAKTRGVVFET